MRLFSTLAISAIALSNVAAQSSTAPAGSAAPSNSTTSSTVPTSMAASSMATTVNGTATTAPNTTTVNNSSVPVSGAYTSNLVTAAQNDINTLQYALTLEQFEAAFYQQFTTNYTSSDFSAAGYNSTVYNNLLLIAAEERIHADTLSSTITSLGGTPVSPCTYNFTAINDVTTFLQYAGIFEGVGVDAYDGALDAISSSKYQTIAAQIAIIEGRHAGYINYLQGIIPFPLVIDNATSPNDTYPLLAPFFETCPNGTASSQWPLPNGVSGISLPVPRTLTQGYSANVTAVENELTTVNYALTFENFEMTFYKNHYAMFSENDFTAAGYNASDYQWVGEIVRDEETHVEILQDLGLLLGNPSVVPICEYNFPNITTVYEFLSLGAIICSTGSSAIAGAAPTVATPALQTAFAQVATVEGRHAAYLDTLVGNNPVYYTFQKAYNATTVVDFVSQYLVSCPYPLAAPSGIVANNTYTTCTT